MIVQTIRLEAFMGRPGTVEVVLPSRGLMVVAGPNGSGKSALIEAVATAGWGQTLRGETPWRRDEPGEVEVETDQGTFLRSVTKGGTKKVKVWKPDSEVELQWPTASKSIETIEAMIGPYEIWRKVSVFSADDVARFSVATDAERKRFLEELLGLERFDLALERCREATRTASQNQQRLANEIVRLTTAAEGRAVRLREAKEALAREVVERPSRAEFEAAKTDVDHAETQLRVFNEKASAHHKALAEAKAQSAHARRHAESLAVDRCPTCERTMKGAAKLVQQVNDAASSAEAEVLALSAVEVPDSSSLVMRLRDTQRLLSAVQARAQAAQEVDTRRQAAKVVVDRLTAEIESAKHESARLADDHNMVQKELAHLQACETVLGLRGVRAQVLGRALEGIEKLTNSVLAKIAIESDFRVQIRSSSVLQSGKSVDVLSIEVGGVGGGYGYRACSTGQRRRIDVALVLALARVAEYAHARQGGTLFLDEVFDGLDDYGVGAIVEVLGEIGRERPVVVITHNPELASRLSPVADRELMFGR